MRIVRKCSELILLVIISFFSCSKEDIAVQPDDSVIEYDTHCVFKDKNGQVFRPLFSNDSTIHVLLPQGVDLSNIEVVFNDVSSENIQLDLSNFSNAPLIEVHDKDSVFFKKVIVYDLPVLDIWTPDSLPITSKEVRVEGCKITSYDKDGKLVEIGTAGIRGRGGSTWVASPKKPYNIKLDKKTSILGLPASKHWILLANPVFDRTQLHNATAYEVARLTDYPWVQSGEFVELILNGEYRGLYYLCEKIRSEKGKIELSKYESGMNPEECGYLLESYVKLEYNLDTSKVDYPFGFFETGICYKTGNAKEPCILGWEVKESDEDELLQNQIDYIKGNLQNLEKLIMENPINEDYRQYFDIETAINWWLVEDACLNEEACRTKNMYLYKNGGGKFCIGPPWDFDAWSFGLYGVEDRTWTLITALYYEKLFQDPVFVNRLKEKWNLYYPIWLEQIPAFIDRTYTMICRSALRNERMYPNWHRLNEYPQTSYSELVNKMKSNFIKQLQIMDGNIRAM